MRSLNLTHCIGCLVFAMAWLWFDIYRPWPKFHSEVMAAAALLLIWGAAARPHAARLLRMPRWVLWVPGVLLLVAMQLVFGGLGFAGDLAVALVYGGSFSLAVILGFSCDPKESRSTLVPLMAAAMAASVVSTAIGWVQWLGLSGLGAMYLLQNALGDPATGNLGQANHFASFSLLGVVAFWAAFEKRWIGLPTLAVAGLFLTVGVVLSNSRTGLMNVVLMAAFVLWKRGQAGLRLPVAAVLVWVLMSAFAALVLPAVSEMLLIRQIDFARGDSVSERRLMWSQAIQAIAQQPWVGYGFEQMTAAQAAAALHHPSGMKDNTYTHAHNLLLDLGVWFGAPVAVLLSLLMAWWLGSRIWRARGVVGVVSLTALLPLATHSLLEFPFAYLYFLVSVGWLMGRVDAQIDQPGASVLPISPMWAWGLLAIGVVLGAFIVRDYALAEEDFRVTRFENRRVGLTPADYVAPELLLLDQLGTMLKATRLRASAGMTAADLDTLRRANQRFAYGALRYRYAQALALNGQLPEGIRQMQLVRAMHGQLFYKACLEDLDALVHSGQPGLKSLLQGLSRS